MDIIDKIRKVAPSEIDKFAAAHDRRQKLSDDKIKDILSNIFKNIDVDKLDPAMAYRYHQIRGRMC